MGIFSSAKLPELLDLTGRVAIVTGANSGIGLWTVVFLARQGAKVYLGARSEEKAKEAMKRINSFGLGDKPGEIVWLDVDLTYPQRAKAAAEYIIFHEQRLDILVNNAGISSCAPESMTVNHFSPFIFTQTLLPLMTKTAKLPDADVRIVNLTSEYHTKIKQPTYESMDAINTLISTHGTAKMRVYGLTKLANILYTKELQKRLDAEDIPIIVIAIHPGVVATEGTEKYVTALPLGSILHPIIAFMLLSPEKGAWNSAFAAASPLVRASPEKYKGNYLLPIGKVGQPSADAQNPKLATDLWAVSEKEMAALE